MNKFVKFLSANRPSILTFVGVGGLIATAVMAYKSYPAVRSKIEELEAEKDPVTVYYDNEPEDIPAVLTRKEKAWVYVRTLWPTFTLGAVSTVLIILGNKDHINRRNAALAAYYISESTLKDYQAEVIKELGEKKEREVRDRVSEKKMEEVPANEQTIIISDTSNPWVCDTATGRYFKMNYEKLRRIIAEANLEIVKRDYISVLDFYEMLGQDYQAFDDRWNYVGWNARYPLEVFFTSAVRKIGEETVPCMIMDYRVQPFENFCYYS